MQFCSKHDKIKIRAMNYLMPNVRNTKFLGVFIDDNMTWRTHMEYLHNKLSMNKNMLSISKNKLDKDSLRKLYFSHIHSHLIYGMKAWVCQYYQKVWIC